MWNSISTSHYYAHITRSAELYSLCEFAVLRKQRTCKKKHLTLSQVDERLRSLQPTAAEGAVAHGLSQQKARTRTWNLASDA